MVTQKLVDCLIWIQHNFNAGPLLSAEACALRRPSARQTRALANGLIIMVAHKPGAHLLEPRGAAGGPKWPTGSWRLMSEGRIHQVGETREHINERLD